MWAWYEKYYKIRDNEKISDQKMMVRFVVTLVIIIVCLLGMSATSIAFYTVSIETGSNTVTPSTFYVLPEVTKEGTPVAYQDGATAYRYRYTLEANSTYTFKVSLPTPAELAQFPSFSETGYCRITAANGYYYTKQLGKDVRNHTDHQELTFTLITGKATEVTVEACWGTCTRTPIINDTIDLKMGNPPAGSA